MYEKIFLGKDVFGLFPSPLHQLILEVRNSLYNGILSVSGTYLASTWTCILQSDTGGGGKKVERKEGVPEPFLAAQAEFTWWQWSTTNTAGQQQHSKPVPHLSSPPLSLLDGTRFAFML